MKNKKKKYIFDTSVLISAIIESHPKHEYCLNLLKKAKDKSIVAAISNHTLMEIYAVLTSLPIRPKIGSELALRIIKKDIMEIFVKINYSSEDYESILQILSKNNITGGSTYDGLIFFALKKSGAHYFVTLNKKDFLRISPQDSNRIIEPDEIEHINYHLNEF